MTIFITEPTQSLTAAVPPFVDLSVNGGRFAVSREINNPTVFVWDDEIFGQADGGAVMSFSDGTAFRFEGLAGVATGITSDGDSVTISGPQDPIDNITINGVLVDFTLGSLAAASGASGIALSVDGYGSEEDAFLDPTPRPFFVRPLGNFDYFGKDGIFSDDLKLGKMDSYTVTVSPEWLGDDTIENIKVTTSSGLELVRPQFQGNVVQAYVKGNIIGRGWVRFDWTTAEAERSDYATVYLGVIS